MWKDLGNDKIMKPCRWWREESRMQSNKTSVFENWQVNKTEESKNMYIEVKKRTNREVAKAREETVKDWNQKLETKEAISVHIIIYLTTFLSFILETDLI
jgi:hypothetical protein